MTERDTHEAGNRTNMWAEREREKDARILGLPTTKNEEMHYLYTTPWRGAKNGLSSSFFQHFFVHHEQSN